MAVTKHLPPQDFIGPVKPKTHNLTPLRRVKGWAESRRQLRAKQFYSKGNEKSGAASPWLTPQASEELGFVSSTNPTLRSALIRKDEVGSGEGVKPTGLDASTAKLLAEKVELAKLQKGCKEYVTGKKLNPLMLEWMNANKILLRKPENWRWLDSALEGEVQGLTHVRGRAMMTDGVLVLIERKDKPVFWGLWVNWVQDEDPNAALGSVVTEEQMQARVAKAKATKLANARKRLEEVNKSAFEAMERLMAINNQPEPEA